MTDSTVLFNCFSPIWYLLYCFASIAMMEDYVNKEKLELKRPSSIHPDLVQSLSLGEGFKFGEWVS